VDRPCREKVELFTRSRRASHSSCFACCRELFFGSLWKGSLYSTTHQATHWLSSRARGTSDRRRSCQSSFWRDCSFSFLPRDTVSIDLCFFVIRSIQDKDKLVLRSYLSSESWSVIFTCPAISLVVDVIFEKNRDRGVLIRRNCFFFSLLFDALRSLAPSRDAMYSMAEPIGRHSPTKRRTIL
jgi:hypothetical protein